MGSNLSTFIFRGTSGFTAPILAARAQNGHMAPLIPAMFLVLAGFGISMLFDKRK